MAESLLTDALDVGEPAPNGDGGPSIPEAVPAVLRFSPNELRVLKAATGRTLTDLQTDDLDMLQAMAWVSLYRLGFRVSWERAGDVHIDMAPERPDPTNGGPSTNSPRSVGSGG